MLNQEKNSESANVVKPSYIMVQKKFENFEDAMQRYALFAHQTVMCNSDAPNKRYYKL